MKNATLPCPDMQSAVPLGLVTMWLVIGRGGVRLTHSFAAGRRVRVFFPERR